MLYVFLIFLIIVGLYIYETRYWNHEYYTRNNDRYLELMKMCSSFFNCSMNMNDTFGYACADMEKIDGEDIEKIFPLFEKYSYAALTAYASVRRNGELPIKELQTKEFFSAKKEIEELAKDGTVLFEEYWDREEKQKFLDSIKDKK